MTGDNYGVVNHASMQVSGGMAVGRGASVTHRQPAAGPAHAGPSRGGPDRVDIGCLTVKAVETRAVLAMLARCGANPAPDRPDGVRLHHATMPGATRPLRVAAMQLVEPGQRSATAGLEHLRQLCAPTVVALVGIAGGIHPDLRLGDVVVSDEVIYYDLRKETGRRTIHRGQIHRSTVPVRRGLNEFFSDHGEPCAVTDPVGPADAYRVHAGPIGSGEAVVACGDAEIRRYLRTVNDKVLAVETEIGGMAQACFEAGADNHPAWLTVRGISDLADRTKSDRHQATAARRAAATFAALVPYLVPAGTATRC